MRIAFLCKRRYMGKDVIVDRYARLYEIPFQLARLGHEVRGYCLSYGRAPEGEWQHPAPPGSLHWESRSLGRWKLPMLLGYPAHLARQLRAFEPEVIIGASDIPQLALGARLAKRLGVPFAADLYDNFEGFGQARIPGFVPALRHAVRNADLVTTTSALLADYVRTSYQARGRIEAMPSTIDQTLFHPRDKQASRHALGLPSDGLLIGTAGGLAGNRGIGTLYAAWPQIAAKQPDAHLVLAGPVDSRCPPPTGDRVHYLGLLSHAKTAELFCALDVGVIYLRDTPFGRYCFPQKLQEMIACDLPIVAAGVGVMPTLLTATPTMLYHATDAIGCARAIAAQLQEPTRCAIAVENWETTVAKLGRMLESITLP